MSQIAAKSNPPIALSSSSKLLHFTILTLRQIIFKVCCRLRIAGMEITQNAGDQGIGAVGGGGHRSVAMNCSHPTPSRGGS